MNSFPFFSLSRHMELEWMGLVLSFTLEVRLIDSVICVIIKVIKDESYQRDEMAEC